MNYKYHSLSLFLFILIIIPKSAFSAPQLDGVCTVPNSSGTLDISGSITQTFTSQSIDTPQQLVDAIHYESDFLAGFSLCTHLSLNRSSFLSLLEFYSTNQTDIQNQLTEALDSLEQLQSGNTLNTPQLSESEASSLFGACALVLALAFIIRLTIHQILNKR